MIRTTGLTKRYGEQYALDAVDIRVRSGSVYGLVGPNGAGKTTLLATLAGLRRATSGSFAIDAAPGKVAVLPDAPRYERWLTAREVVDLARDLVNQSDEAATDRVLGLAGLTDAAEKRVGGFSRGMLQRLGLAATVVGAPDVVLLDEPASALDPAGRREVLDLISEMRGTSTVVFSSHILEDVESVCDHVGVLRHGRLVFEGATEDLLSGAASQGFVIRVRDDAHSLAAALAKVPWVTSAEATESTEVRVAVSDQDRAEVAIAGVLAAEKVRVMALQPIVPTLESVFLELTKEPGARE